MNKVYERTENGTTAYVSIREGLAEVERADREFDELGIRSRSSKGSTHFIEYGDGRKVLFELVKIADVKLTDTMKGTLAKLARGEFASAGVSTFRALERRGLVTANTAPRDPAKGWWCHYMLTDAGREVAPQESTEGAVCGNRWKYGKDVCAREASHVGPHRNTEALEAWSFQWFDSEGTLAEEGVAAAASAERAPRERASSKPVTPKGRKCLEYVRAAGRPVPLSELSKAGFNGNTVNSIDGCLRFRPEPYIQRTPAGYVLTDLGRRELGL